MKTLPYFVLMIGASALFAGCGGSPLPIGAPSAMQQASGLAARNTSSNYRVLYSFSGPPDGYQPGSLLDVSGTLYGTTADGGAYNACYDYSYPHGCGTVFGLTTGGMEKVLYSFHGSDGRAPESLLDMNGTLYGTTAYGGTLYNCGFSVAIGCGTVFSLTMGGSEKVLHDFGGVHNGVYDGQNPSPPLIEVKHKFYGTTGRGGAYDRGTVFSVTRNGSEKVLYSFQYGGDGDAPSGLVELKGKFYGTTLQGGTHFYGTVFSVTRGGKEKVLHSFGYGTDGFWPYGALIAVKGKLYGTTSDGGAHGYGTVYRITTRGAEKVLYSFAGGSDGNGPHAGLVDVGGTLYGTTVWGGAYATTYGEHGGTIFSVTRGGKEKILHSFGSGTDGTAPYASLIDVNGTLYGTTLAGGTSGNGTVFALSIKQ